MEDFLCRAGGKRALRRHHRQRLKDARRFYWGVDLINDVRRLGMLVNTAAICSCWTCCNERRRNGKGPIQERKQLQIDMWEDYC